MSGKYRLESVLGQGAMGVVLAARHEALDQPVAIKIVAADGVEKGEALARFLREARVVARLESEHVVRVMDVGALDDGSPYMVMELLRGIDLAAVLEKNGALPISEAIDDVLEAMDAIAEAHAGGIVHRDVKPSNLFRAERSDGTTRIKVLDFGISKVAIDGMAAISLTKTHTMLGTPLYMSPEQILATKTVDARADIWSLGVVLYELLAGQPPFVGDTMGTLLAAVLSGPIPRVSATRDVPPELDLAIARCLERDVEQRFPNLSELADVLAPYGSTRSHVLVERIQRLVAQRPRHSLLEHAPATERVVIVPTVTSRPAVPDVETQLAAPTSLAFRVPKGPLSLPSSVTPAPAPRVPPAVTLTVVAALLLGLLGGWLLRGARDRDAGGRSGEGPPSQSSR